MNFLLAFGIVGIGIYFLLFIVPKWASASEKPSPTIDILISRASIKHGVETALIKAIIRQESNFNPNAINPTDPSYGLMQVGLMVAQDYGLVKDYRSPTLFEKNLLLVPETNIDIGTWHLSKLLSRYVFDIAVQMYNLGEAKYGYGFRSPEYLEAVRGYYNVYKN